MPPLMIFMIWNGYTTSKGAAAGWNKWILYVNPIAYSIEAISLAAQLNEDPCPAASTCKRKLWDDVVREYDYSDNRATGVVVDVIATILFRIGQVIALRVCNKIEK